jgi:hypothetical protein
MELLREKRFEMYKVEKQKAEGREQDEQYVMRARLVESSPGESHEE